MPFYQQQGKIPPKRHTVFKKDDGSLYYEELVSREGFSHMYSIFIIYAYPSFINWVTFRQLKFLTLMVNIKLDI